MELRLNFAGGNVTGEGRDWVGYFILRGRYFLADATCNWNKQDIGKHTVYYRGFNEGKGIWGTWEIPDAPPEFQRGGFHIWPEGMPDPTAPHANEEAEVPMPIEEVIE